MSKLLKNLLIHSKLRTGDGEENDESHVPKNSETGETLGSGNDARIALLNSISDQNDQARAEELMEIGEDGNLAPFVPPAGGESEDAEAQAAREAEEVEAARKAAESAAAEVTEDPPAKVTYKLDGQDVELTDDMIRKILQKDNVTDEVAQRAAQEAEQQRQQQAKEAEDNRLLDVVRAIQLGTEEEALAAVKVLKEEAQPKLASLDKLIDEKLSINEAVTKFKDDFKDIVSDPVLMQWAISADLELQQKGDKRSHSERYTAIGNNIRQWLHSKVPPQQQSTEEKSANKPSVEVSTTKQQAKAAAPAFPKAAGGKHAPVAEEETEESVQDVIAEMAKKRGGPQWMNGASR